MVHPGRNRAARDSAAIGWIAIRFPLNRVIASYFRLTTIAMLIFGGIAMPAALTLMMTLIIGVTVQGGFNGFWALAAKLYPAEMRSTGVGGVLGVGRIGAVLGAHRGRINGRRACPTRGDLCFLRPAPPGRGGHDAANFRQVAKIVRAPCEPKPGSRCWFEPVPQAQSKLLRRRVG